MALTPAEVRRAISKRLVAAGLVAGRHSTATQNPASLAKSTFTITVDRVTDTGKIRTKSDGKARMRFVGQVEILHRANPKDGQDNYDIALDDYASVIRHLHVEETELTREVVVEFGDATISTVGGGAYLSTKFQVLAEFTFSIAVPS